MKTTIKGKTLKIKNFEFFIPETQEEKNINPLFSVILIKKKNKITPVVALIEVSAEEDYDYDYDENLISNGIVETTRYYPIPYNPYNGSAFEFVSTETVDKTKELDEINEQKLSLKKMRKSQKKDLIVNQLYEKERNLFKDIPFVFEYCGKNIFSENFYLDEYQICYPHSFIDSEMPICKHSSIDFKVDNIDD